MTDRTVAVIDVGSGSVKLLITGLAGLVDRNAELAHIAIKTRLSDGGAATVTAEAMAATEAAFDVFATTIADQAPSEVRVIGTAAVRQLADGAGLAELALDRFGVPLDVIDGDLEAELALAGAILGRGGDEGTESAVGPAAVIDIGSASTEFAVHTAEGAVHSFSMPLGAGNVTSTYLTSDPPRPDELSAALSVIELHLDDLRREVPAYATAVEDGRIYGTGAMTQIAEVEIGVPDPDAASVDGCVLDREGAEEVFRALATESNADRAHNPGLRAQHVGDIVGAMCVLVEFIRQFGVDEITISERGLMHGLAAELLAER